MLYSNVSRGKRREKGVAAGCAAIQEPLSSSSDYRRRWAQLIKKVYEVDPLICPKCGGEMKIVAFIQERRIIDRVLAHLGLKEEHAHSPPKREEAIEELTCEPVYGESPFTDAAVIN